MKKHNFSAGPSILSPYTIEHTASGIRDLDSSGLSIMEISHRSKEFMAIMDETQQLFVELLDIPSGYSVLLLQGGASMQFCMVPYNLLQSKAAYLDTGSWANKAVKEAKFFGEVDVLASSKDTTYSYIPRDYTIPADADYFHITTNNTIYGTEIREDMDVPVNLVADMSSDIFSRPIDVSKYAIIYGGAQKNLAPAGVTFVIIKDAILGKVDRAIPTMLDYRTHIDKESMFNTPPVVPIYAALHTLRWYKEQGGVSGMYKLNVEKAGILYDEIERNSLFTSNIENVEDRSIMNVTFIMKEAYKEKEADFLTFATGRGMSGIKGHRSVGGFRASIYNAMPRSSVEALIDTMKDFEKSI
ncbi:MAG: 3-phosphoserine/phosphohydroxythreonine transaminase [Bacteroidales bacterium]|nr:3-phosphoserine/phosphohydroxythreonine transaminase [Bacteroidales bacterium]